MLSKGIHGFLRWFSSRASVWQTTLVIVAIASLLTWRQRWDPGYLRFLLVLSLYATFTQNALAYLTERRDQQNEEMLDQQRQMLINQVDQMALLIEIAKASRDYEQRMEPLVAGAIQIVSHIQTLTEGLGASDQALATGMAELREMKDRQMQLTERTLGVVEQLISLQRTEKE